MENQNIKRNDVVDSSTDTDTTVDYISAINEIKQNSVDKAKYEALRLENKKLLSSIVNGQTIEMNAEKPEVNIQELREKLFNTEEQSNLEYVTTALKLREALIEKGEKDPFVPVGSQYNPTQLDYERANRVATILQEIVDVADGDNNIFINEFQRRLK